MAKCPICKRETDPAMRPFCSKRCADVDLHRWLNGVYAVPGGGGDDDEEAEAELREGRDPQSR